MKEDAGAWDPVWGTAGGKVFGEALRALAAEQEVSEEALAAAAGIPAEALAAIVAGDRRAGLGMLARMAVALRCRPMEFMQRTHMVSLAAYAFGLDPLYFLPEGPIRYDARIYMREINPRHAVPEGDMTKRNATLKALSEDVVLDPVGRVEVELAYLLRAAVQETGGTL
ncbi:MAG: helix-turn-helix domain-containing protein [Candidatus Eremiobacteraeota bacterium]|nr:helix-turn-helix domain-containing protein [Candidatus Eremiobacteraeota bacterium]